MPSSWHHIAQRACSSLPHCFRGLVGTIYINENELCQWDGDPNKFVLFVCLSFPKFHNGILNDFTYLCVPAQVISYHPMYHPESFRHSYLGTLAPGDYDCFNHCQTQMLRSQNASFYMTCSGDHQCVPSFTNKKGVIFLSHCLHASVGLPHTANIIDGEVHNPEQHPLVLISTGHLSCLGMDVPESSTSAQELL